MEDVVNKTQSRFSTNFVRRTNSQSFFWRFIHLVVILLVTVPNSVDAKSERGSFTLPLSNGVHYATHWGCGIGMCNWKFRVRVAPQSWSHVAPVIKRSASSSSADPKSVLASRLQDKTSMIHLRVYLDDTWDGPDMRKRPVCSNSIHAKVTRYITLPLNGDWSGKIFGRSQLQERKKVSFMKIYFSSTAAWTEGSFSQVVRPHLWYFTLEDCEGTVADNLALYGDFPREQLRNLKFHWEIYATQANGGHFSYEYHGAFAVGIFHCACYIILLLLLVRHELREMRRSGKVHIMTQMLNTCVLSQLASSIFYLLHLAVYARNGHGMPGLQTLAEALAVLSQIMMSSTLLFIAAGFSLNLPFALPFSSAVAVPIVIVVAGFHIILVLVDSYNADPRFKFHAAGGPLGLFITLLRLVLWGAFVFQAISTSQKLKSVEKMAGAHARSHAATADLSAFLHRVTIAGSVYFLAFPFVHALTAVFAPYLRHRVLSNGIFIMQMGSMLWLSRLFLDRSHRYFKVSEMRQSYLPGGYLSPTGLQRFD